MLYTAQEVSDKLHISKVTVYKKLKLPKFSDKTIIQNEQIFIDDDLLGLINDSLQIKADITDDSEVTADTLETDEVQDNNDVLTAYKLLTDTLINQLEGKDNQLVAKDLQINNLNDRLKQEQELNKNNQILQLRPQQDIKQLEEHFKDLDSKLIDIRDQMEEQQIQKVQEHISFFGKLFKR